MISKMGALLLEGNPYTGTCINFNSLFFTTWVAPVYGESGDHNKLGQSLILR